MSAPCKVRFKSADDDIQTLREAIERRLDAAVPITGLPSRAARHTLLAAGKRLRAIMTMLAAETFGGNADATLDPACAVEMIHTASLIFDDLPAMDDAALRRGRQTAHVAFGEDVAILGGIGLLNGAYRLVARCETIPKGVRSDIVDILSAAVGWEGLVQGQALDLDAGKARDVTEIHDGKTGVLFEAAVLTGVLSAGRDLSDAQELSDYARAFGRAYQAYDDLLDRFAPVERTGKTMGQDSGKRTALSTCGHDREIAHDAARRHLGDAIAALGPSRKDSPLAGLARRVERHFQEMVDDASAISGTAAGRG